MSVEDFSGPSSSDKETILFAIRHFSLLCVSIQHEIFGFLKCSSASLVLLLMYSIQSSSFSVESIASSISSWKDTSLSWSLLLRWSEPSSVSLSVACLLSSSACLSVPSFYFVRCIFFQLVFSFCLYDKAKHLSLCSFDHFFVFLR